ncbi:MAG TPA: PQQ-dependent sugar dehydrogenase, partial [Devosia sp.]|nr:PQQ-dependent sugar dehydrogenase [Devosia sp.]
MAAASLAQDATVLTGKNAYGDWEKDAPGVTRLLTPADMEAPNLTPSASNSPSTVVMPDGAMPKVPDGFKVELVASGIENPRAIRFAPNGDLFVGNSQAGNVLVYHFENGAAKPATEGVFAEGLNQPYGVAFYPAGADPQWIYVAESDGLKRFPYKSGDMKASGAPETLFDNINPDHHWTRDVGFSPDGKTMYYSVGSGSNVGDGTMEPEPEGGVAAWASAHPLGVAWGEEERRAAVLAFDPDGKNERYFATGLRNCAGMTLQPATGEPWCVVNNVDELGDNVPFEFATSVKDGAFYGWPWYYIGDNPDPRWEVNPRPDLKGQVTVGDVLFQAHSAPLNIAFYDNDAWGADYKGDAFVALHGSWNRGQRTGYKVVRLDFDAAGKPTGTYEDFMTGFVVDADTVWGRPVGVAVSPDGALFVSEDGS